MTITTFPRPGGSALASTGPELNVPDRRATRQIFAGP
jgi:hypothetical protein